MRFYKLIVNEDQIKAIQLALESYVRLGLGQLENILLSIGFKTYNQNSISAIKTKELEESIKLLKYKMFQMSFHSSLSIKDSKVDENFKVCYDLFNSIQKKVSTPINGFISIQSDSPECVSKNGIIEIELQKESSNATGKKE